MQCKCITKLEVVDICYQTDNITGTALCWFSGSSVLWCIVARGLLAASTVYSQH